MFVKDKLKGLFVEIGAIQQLEIFSYFSPVLLDNLYINMHGNRTISTNIEETPIDLIAEMLLGLNGVKWDNILTQYTESITELKNNAETFTENMTDTANNNFTRDIKNQVSAYNDENFVDDTSEKETQITTADTVKTREHSTIKIRDVKEYENLINYLQNNFLCGIIFKDVNSFTTLSIYEY